MVIFSLKMQPLVQLKKRHALHALYVDYFRNMFESPERLSEPFPVF